MSGNAYYNENDPGKAAWLRENIKAGLIASGEVDERSIEDVLPNELAEFTQCHFFAGIGVWSYALRNAGWPDNQSVWTGSCPCQPFSTAGKRAAFADERHLWPAWEWLIRQCRPDVIFGEQVENKDGRAWLDLVQADLEASSYAVGAVGLCAAGFGACHARHRLFFVADTTRGSVGGVRDKWEKRRAEPSISGAVSELANSTSRKQWGIREFGAGDGWRQLPVGRHCAIDELADTDSTGRAWQGQTQPEIGRSDSVASRRGEAGKLGYAASNRREERQREDWESNSGSIGAGATNGFWADAEWLDCRDEKYRAVKPGTFPLAHGVARRVLKLRGIGDSIVAPVAEEFIRAYLDFIGE